MPPVQRIHDASMLVDGSTNRIIPSMLTDIFAYRYADVPIWDEFTERERRLIVQALRIITDHIYLPYSLGKKNEGAQAKLKSIHDKLANELGHHALSSTTYSYPTQYAGKSYTQSGSWSWDHVCKEYMCLQYLDSWDADVFTKNRLSFIEIAFRQRAEEIASLNANLPGRLLQARVRAAGQQPRLKLPGDPVEAAKVANREMNDKFQELVDELNTRFRQAGAKLNYHNGFIQISTDEQVEEQIAAPFWALVADPKWENVNIDMMESLDLRDSGGRDPSWFAAKALESTIKIISNEKGWNHGGERGAANFIDNLAAKKNGQFIAAWESASMKLFFKNVRNPFGHGSGSDKMPNLGGQQTNWAIEFCMIWAKSLIERM